MDNNDTEMLSSPTLLPPLESPQTPTSSQGQQQLQAECLVPTDKAADMEKKKGFVILQKRGMPFEFDTSPSIQTRTFKAAKENSQTGEELVEQARQLLIQALPKLQDDKQDRAQNLLTQFEAFKQGTPIMAATAKIERQIQVLQQTVDRMSRLPTTNPSSQASQGSQATVRTQQRTTSPQSSYASAVQRNIPVGESTSLKGQTSQPRPQEWTTIRTKKQAQAQEQRKRLCQIVLELQNKTTPIDPAPLRNRINKAFQTTGFQGVVVLSARKSAKDNLVIMCTNTAAKEYVLNRSRTLFNVVGEARVIEDSTWFKVVAHGVPQAYFSYNNPQEVAEEVKQFNTGLTPIGTPVWLTGQQYWGGEKAGASVLLAFPTEEQATRAIQDRLWIGATSVRVEPAKDSKKKQDQPPTSTC